MKKKATASALLAILAMQGGCYLTRGITPEQINKQAENGVIRSYALSEVRNIDEEARTVEVAFSSETPVERWFGEEILDHSPGAMIEDRLRNSMAVLMDHAWSDQVAVVESYSIGSDRRGRAVVRFSKSARASEIFQDVVDGIRKHISVGYLVRKVEVEERAGQADLVRVTQWEPYEISFVSVPADSSVGVGRSMENPPVEENRTAADTGDNTDDLDNEPEVTMEKILRNAKGDLVRALVDEDGKITKELEVIEKAGDGQRTAHSNGLNDERARVRELNKMGDSYNAMDLARKMIDDGKTAEDMRAALLDKMTEERAKPMEEQRSSEVGLSDKEVQQYSFQNVIRALANPTDRRAQEAAKFEIEAGHAAAERQGKQAQGIMVPHEVLTRTVNTSTSGTNPGDTGGNIVATDLMSGSFIDMLRNRTFAMQVGRTMGGLVGNVDIPRQAGGASGFWLGEDEDVTASEIEFDQIGLSPKTVGGMTEFTRRMMLQSTPDIENLVRSDIAAALAQTIDLAVLYGTATGNQPRGIANTSGINAVGFGSAGGDADPTYADLVDMESEVAADNADFGSLAYALNTRMRGTLKTTQKFEGTNGAPVWEQGNTVNGYSTQVTNQVQDKDVFFANWADLIIGMWGGLDLTVDPYTHSQKGRVRVVAFQDVDFILRRLESFCLGRPTPAQ